MRYFIKMIKIFKVTVCLIIMNSLVFFITQCMGEEIKDRKIRSYWELKFLNIDRQAAEFSCGIAVLATLFTHYFDIPVKEEEITEEFFKKMVEEKRGISFLDMKRFALSIRI